jgi:hypothetical protein
LRRGPTAKTRAQIHEERSRPLHAWYETRTDWAMLLGALSVLLTGDGPRLLDRLLFGPSGG